MSLITLQFRSDAAFVVDDTQFNYDIFKGRDGLPAMTVVAHKDTVNKPNYVIIGYSTTGQVQWGSNHKYYPVAQNINTSQGIKKYTLDPNLIP